MKTIACQLYCSRHFPPLDATMRMLADVGYRNVEGYGALFDDPAALKDALEAAGLRMPSAHFALDMVEGAADTAIGIARTLGIGKMIVPHIAAPDRPVDAAGWAAFGARLAKAAKPVTDAGLIFGWHNHDFELADLGGSDVPLDLIAQASDDIMLELDLGWIRVSGHDPVPWIDKYPGRITAAHVKDVAPDGDNLAEDGWADVGHGIMDWPALVAALGRAGCDHYVAEHDNPSDHRRFATRSLATIRTFEGV